MSDSARHNLLYVLEGTRGTTPTASPVLLDLRHTSCTLKLAKATNKSAELHQDRQVRNFRHGAKQVNGDIGFEFSYGSFDDVLQAAAGGTWAVKATKTATTISALAADNSLNDSGNGFVTAGFEPGDKVTISGFTGAGSVANNVTATINTVAAGKIVLLEEEGVELIDDAAGEAVTVATTATVLKIGTIRRFFTMIRHFSDLLVGASPYHFFPGCEFTSLNLTVPAEGLVTGQVSVLGMRQTLAGDLSSLTTPQVGSPTTTEPYDSHTGAHYEGGSAVSTLTELAFTLNNGNAARFVVGSAETREPTIGQADVTGTATHFFEGADLLEKFLDEEESSIRQRIVDPAGNAYEFFFPKVKYNDAPTDATGQGAISVALPFQALYDTVTATTLRITKLPA